MKPEVQGLARAIAAGLQPWFETAQRDLPWRRTADPYAIWVSEIMLQQTRVETVERYWADFLGRFPTVEALAAAEEADVLEAWSGLGYYRRARLLHRGARFVAEEFSGRVPEELESLREIPGVGRYTAGAIASIAFDTEAALVDGNVARVFSRVQAIEDPKAQGAHAKEHWELAGAVLANGRPRILAQALMELGATVCTPRLPSCSACPISSVCEGQDRADVIPAVRKKVPQPKERWWALAVVREARLLLVRRPPTGLLASLWCLPLLPASGRPRKTEVLAALGLDDADVAKPQPSVRHVFTHRIWDMRPLAVTTQSLPALPGFEIADTQWIASGERPAGGLPSATVKLLRALGYADV